MQTRTNSSSRKMQWPCSKMTSRTSGKQDAIYPWPVALRCVEWPLSKSSREERRPEAFPAARRRVSALLRILLLTGCGKFCRDKRIFSTGCAGTLAAFFIYTGGEAAVCGLQSWNGVFGALAEKILGSGASPVQARILPNSGLPKWKSEGTGQS
ncbi:hypothetical protein B0T24DRAFT_94519 [Lasiosphaeria ovina]|uniref:Uncharacterized protein n=1 Tax=Lasiosphaeria ovina TaxID=92902 RepID=A0AAE0NN86_9PEZI|nr:hypothetical protein B0T24DRAFT_94519 [Lasiosphaeria ovina]